MLHRASGCLKGRDHLRDIVVDGRKLLKLIQGADIKNALSYSYNPPVRLHGMVLRKKVQ
jgi:hypothetical protein